MIKKIHSNKKVHVYIILLFLIFVACIMTFIIPAGSFERISDPLTNKSIVLNGSYKFQENTYVKPWEIPAYIFKTLITPSVSRMIFFILIIGGSFEPLMESGSFSIFINKMIYSRKTSISAMILSFLVAFSIIGFTTGLTTASIIFVPIALSISRSIGLDDIIGISMVMLGTNVGFTAGIFNPFNVGIAQTIAEIPMFSGSWIRWIVLVVYLIVTGLYLIYFAKKDKYFLIENNENNDKETVLSKKQKTTLFSFVVFLSILMIGINIFKWSIPEIASLFITYGIIVGIIMGYSPNEICDLYVSGFKKMVKGAFIIGLAATIKTILVEGQILDTIAYFMSMWIFKLPSWAQLTGVFFVNGILNLLITSGSGQAALIMPILVPMSDILNLSRQSVVLAFQMGDGLTNLLSPISTTLSTILAISGVHYGKWFKFFLPLVIIYMMVGIPFMILASMTAY